MNEMQKLAAEFSAMMDLCLNYNHPKTSAVLREWLWDNKAGLIAALRAQAPFPQGEPVAADAADSGAVADGFVLAGAAFAEVVRQADAVYADERNDIQDRRAIRNFADRFRIGDENCRVRVATPTAAGIAAPAVSYDDEVTVEQAAAIEKLVAPEFEGGRWVDVETEAAPPAASADAVREALASAETWCSDQAYKIGNVDGYDYRSGEEAAYRHAAIELKKRAATLTAPVAEADSKS